MRVPENLKIFSILSIVYSYFFFLVLYNYVQGRSWWAIACVCIIYAALMIYTGAKLGQNTPAESLRTNKAFAFHLAAYLTVNLVHALFFVFDWTTAGASLMGVVFAAAGWGISLMLHGFAVGRQQRAPAV